MRLNQTYAKSIWKWRSHAERLNQSTHLELPSFASTAVLRDAAFQIKRCAGVSKTPDCSRHWTSAMWTNSENGRIRSPACPGLFHQVRQVMGPVLFTYSDWIDDVGKIVLGVGQNEGRMPH